MTTKQRKKCSYVEGKSHLGNHLQCETLTTLVHDVSGKPLCSLHGGEKSTAPFKQMKAPLKHVHGDLAVGTPTPLGSTIEAGLMNPPEKVNHPAHYNSGGIEVIDVIEAFGLGFNLGNAVKYICRAERKGAADEDMEKALWYLNRAINNRKAGKKP